MQLLCKNQHNRFISIITARKRSLGQGNIFRSVCQEFCPWGGGGVPGTPPRADTPQAKYTPWDQVNPPRTRYTPWDQVPPWDQAHPLGTRYTSLGPGTPSWDQVHPLGPGTPPRIRYPPEKSILGDTVNVQAVRILLECNLVFIFKQEDDVAT